MTNQVGAPSPPPRIAAVRDDGHLVPLRPYGLPEILVGAARAVRRAPLLLLGTGVVVGLLTVLVQLLAGSSTTVTRDGTRTVLHEHLAGTIAVHAPALFAALAVLVVTPVVLLQVAAQTPAPEPVLRRAARRFPVLVQVAVIRLAVLVLLGPFAVGVYLYVQWSMAPYAATAEDAGVLVSLRRSALLVRESWWRVAGLLLVGFAAVELPQVLLNAAFAVGTYDTPGSYPSLAQTVIAAVLCVLTVPLGIALATLVYADLRCRTEGLAWKLDAARRNPERPVEDAFGAGGTYAAPPWIRRPAR
ncbi:MAG TPA: hypothetical protein VHC41_10505 [Mycobacteriales bacterium]|nr:hypothetical protein [Mycobacteriales bacterium]